MRDSVAECGPIATGDWIAIAATASCVATKSATDAAIALVDSLVDDDTELVTIIVGADADAGDTVRDQRADRARASRRGGRAPRGRPAALPLPHRCRVAHGHGAARRPDAARPRRPAGHRAQGRRREVAARPGRDGHHDRARPARALPAPLPRPHHAPRSPSSKPARRRRSTPRCARSAPAARATASAPS